MWAGCLWSHLMCELLQDEVPPSPLPSVAVDVRARGQAVGRPEHGSHMLHSHAATDLRKLMQTDHAPECSVDLRLQYGACPDFQCRQLAALTVPSQPAPRRTASLQPEQRQHFGDCCALYLVELDHWTAVVLPQRYSDGASSRTAAAAFARHSSDRRR